MANRKNQNKVLIFCDLTGVAEWLEHRGYQTEMLYHPRYQQSRTITFDGTASQYGMNILVVYEGDLSVHVERGTHTKWGYELFLYRAEELDSRLSVPVCPTQDIGNRIMSFLASARDKK